MKYTEVNIDGVQFIHRHPEPIFIVRHMKGHNRCIIHWKNKGGKAHDIDCALDATLDNLNNGVWTPFKEESKIVENYDTF